MLLRIVFSRMVRETHTAIVEVPEGTRLSEMTLSALYLDKDGFEGEPYDKDDEYEPEEGTHFAFPAAEDDEPDFEIDAAHLATLQGKGSIEADEEGPDA